MKKRSEKNTEKKIFSTFSSRLMGYILSSALTEYVWDEVRQMVNNEPTLEAVTIFEYLKDRYPDDFTDGQLRTLQRRLKRWRATEGPAKEVMFGQEDHPGRLSQSDFTHMNELGDR